MANFNNKLLWKRFRDTGNVEPATILKWWGVADTPIPVEHIVLGMDVAVEEVDTNEFAGTSETTETSALIRIRLRDARVRKRFTLAHELGHVLMHPIGDNFRDADFTPFTQQEMEANHFAASLLMPDWMIRHAVDNIGFPVPRLAAMFDVSAASMEYRLKQVYKDRR